MNARTRSGALAIVVLGSLGLLAPGALAQETVEPKDLYELSIEDLLNLEVSTPSRRPQELREVPVTTYVVTEEDFRTYGYRDLKDVLRNLPGIEYIYPFASLFGGQRGFSSFWENTKILINGLETNILSDFSAWIVRQFQLTGIKRVEVVQGPASVLYGPEAFSGVINIVTKDLDNNSPGSELAGIVGGGYRSSRDVNGAFYNLAKKDSLSLAVSAYVDGSRGPDFTNFVKTTDFSEINRDLRAFLLDHGNPYRDDGRNLWFNADLTYSPVNRLQVKAGAFYWRAQEGFGELPPALVFTNDEFIVEQTHLYVGGDYEFATAPVKIALLYHFMLENEWIRNQSLADTGDNPPFLAALNFEGSRLNVVNLQVDYFPSFIDNYFLAGVGMRDTLLGEPAFTGQSPTDVTPGQPVSLVGRYLYPPPGYFSDVRPFLRQNRFYLYGQDQQNFWDKRIQLTAGLRYDHNSVYGGILNVRSGVLFRPLTNYTIRGFFGQGFREPTVFDLAANRSLVPQRMNSWEVSFLFTPVRNLSGQIAYFQNRASQLIVTQCEVASSFCLPQNLGVKRVAGIETLIRYQGGSFGGDFWHSYEYSMDDQPLLGTAQNKLGLGGHYDYRNHFTLALRARFTSEARGLALDSEQNQFILTVPKYFTLDLNVLAKNLAFAGVNWDLSFSIFNILNRENFYVNPLGPNPNRYLAGGREYFGQVRIRY
jgi:outer membrane receptor for ferrienterochelin and colicins